MRGRPYGGGLARHTLGLHELRSAAGMQPTRPRILARPCSPGWPRLEGRQNGRMQPAPVEEADYARLLAFRTRLREFLAWSAERAAEQGLTPAQHQLMLAIRGHADSQGPTITEAAAYLLIRHHAAVGLANRVQALGLLERHPDPADARAVRLKLTAEGDRRIQALSALHKAEVSRLAPLLDAIAAQTASSRPSSD